jgi:DHA1 family bicyclomycin/chloramphenicol resistance-like MFS transporter
LILGLLSAIGPFAIDMYLPALPQIGASLNAPVSAVQASLTAFFLALGVGQPLFGSLADLWGRKPLYLGLAIFVLASIGCALAQDIRDPGGAALHPGSGRGSRHGVPAPWCGTCIPATRRRMMSLLMLVFSVSPILAPLAGSAVIGLGGWRGCSGRSLRPRCWACWPWCALPKPAAQRRGDSSWPTFKAYALLLRDWHYLGLVFIGAAPWRAFSSTWRARPLC